MLLISMLTAVVLLGDSEDNLTVVKMDKTTVTKRLYDIEEAAVSLGMSARSVRRLVKRKLLTPNRVLGKLLFSAAELDRIAAR